MRQSISRFLFVFVSFLFAFIILVPKAGAQNCTTQYGGGQTCLPVDLTINKQIKDLSTSNFFDNLSVSSSSFALGNQFTFRLTITNSSGETFTNINVRDIFPPTMAFVSGPGTYDAGSRTLNFTIDSLPAGQNRVFDVVAKVTSTMASAQCAVNSSSVTALQRPTADDDTAQICVTGQVLGVTTLPVAGVNDLWVISISALSGIGGLALLLKK